MGTIERALQKVQRGSRWTRETPPRDPASKRGDGQAASRQESTNERVIVLDYHALRDEQFLPEGKDQDILAEQYRVIKRPLVAQAFGNKKAERADDGNIIQVTSSLANEGKTFTCINLALSLAQEQDSTILLVDGDVANPELSKLFNLADEPGLLDYLEEPNRDLSSIVYRTELPSLSIVPAGKPRADSGELVASDRINRFVQLTARRHKDQIVLIDSPPMLLSSVAAALATIAGQIVVVVKAGSTPQDNVREAVMQLDETKPINFILNQATNGFSFGGYGTYGQYGTYGATEGKKRDTRPIAQATQSSQPSE